MKNLRINCLLLLSLCFFPAYTQTLEPTENKALLNILVVSSNKQPLEGEIVSFISSVDKKEYKKHTNAEGKFSILVPIGATYIISYKNFTEDVEYSSIEIPGEKGIYTVDITITFEPGTSVILQNVEYDFNKATLRSSSYKTLNNLAEVMKIKHNMKVEISGHTDDRGTEEYNQKLSQARAESVRNYLISKGIKADRIIAKGYGSTRPVDYNSNPDGSDNPEGRQRNRRTEVSIID